MIDHEAHPHHNWQLALSRVGNRTAKTSGPRRFQPDQRVNINKPFQIQDSIDATGRLTKAEIIPTVFDAFKPFLKLEVKWKHAAAEVGNTVKPSKVQDTPTVSFIGTLPDLFSAATADGVPQLTLALTDPDAPSRENPEWSQICHWLATDITLTSSGAVHNVQHFDEIVPYKPPGPPPKTGKHRYVFAALAPANGTTEKLHQSKPGGRQHWGYSGERQGLRDWAEENGLEVVGASFHSLNSSLSLTSLRRKLHLLAEQETVDLAS